MIGIRVSLKRDSPYESYQKYFLLQQKQFQMILHQRRQDYSLIICLLDESSAIQHEVS